MKTADKQKTTISVCVISTSNSFSPLNITESDPHQFSLVDKDQVTESPSLARKVSQKALSSEEPTSFYIGTSDSILNEDTKPFFHTTRSQSFSFSQSINNLSTAVPAIIPLQLSSNWEETKPVSLPHFYVDSKYNKPVTQARPYLLLQPYPFASVNYLPNY